VSTSIKRIRRRPVLGGLINEYHEPGERPGQPRAEFWKPTPNLGAGQSSDGQHRHVGDDLAACYAFFVALGLELEGEAQSRAARWNRIVGLEGVRSDIAMMRTPDATDGSS